VSPGMDELLSPAVLECRPLWREDFGPEWTRFPICRFRYTKVRKE